MANAAARWNQLVNKNENLKYVWASLADDSGGLGYYSSIGYEEVRYEEDGVRPAAANRRKLKVGEPIEMMGCVLMAIEKEEAERIEQVGLDGGSGQAYVDRVEKILGRRNRLALGGENGLVLTKDNKYTQVRDWESFDS